LPGPLRASEPSPGRARLVRFARLPFHQAANTARSSRTTLKNAEPPTIRTAAPRSDPAGSSRYSDASAAKAPALAR
jgi:hypothetical protein